MPVIYKVFLDSEGKEKLFRVTWHNLENNSQDCFIRESEITPEEIQWLWQIPSYQLEIGQKLFRFLDGEAHHLQQALNQANLQGEILQVYLHTCKQTADWPFEFLAKDSEFLLLQRVHLVRTVSDWGSKENIPPENRPLKLLFMACSPLDVESELDFEREEETIFRITEKLFIDIEVEDSGSLEGLRSKLAQEQYDVVHLSGHADIDKNSRPYFVMEDETGYQHNVYPEDLWNEALIENPPRLLFLSGCRTGEVPESADKLESVAEGSFARLLVKNYNLPAVLGWGRTVSDNESSHAGKILFHELSRGKSILEAVQRARFELIKNFPTSEKPAWPLLRLYSNGMPLNPIVKKGQRFLPKTRRMKHIFLKNSQVKVLDEGFVGRRRQLQTSLRALKQDNDKVGVVLLGTGGLGKSCLAGKICERFNDHTLIIVHGRFNAITLENALTDAFIIAQDEKGQEILSQKQEMPEMEESINSVRNFYMGIGDVFLENSPPAVGDKKTYFMTDKLTRLCAASFKEKNYLLLLDDFELNLECAEKGQPGPLLPEAEDLLNVLLHQLPFSGKMTQLIITSRYEFSLMAQDRNLIKECLEKVWLTSFREAEQRKKVRELQNIVNYENQSEVPYLISAGLGNPRLMEWMDVLVGQLAAAEVPQLLEAIRDKQEDFIRLHVIRELFQQGGVELERFLNWFSIYRLPVLEEGAAQVAERAGLVGCKELLKKGMRLSLIEHDQVRQIYQVTLLLREELLKELEDYHLCHDAAFAYYKNICEDRDSINPILWEEWVFHALGCGEEEVASQQGTRLIIHLRELLALQESRRLGEWILSEKKRECSTEDDAFLLNAIAYTINEQGDHQQAIVYFQQAVTVFQEVNGKEHINVAISLNNLSAAYTALGNHSKAIDYSQQALNITKSIYGENHPSALVSLINLGSTYHLLGDHFKAKEYLEQSLSINNIIWSERNPIASRILNNIASVWFMLGEHHKAIGYLKKALSIDREIYGDKHPDVARELNNLGEAYRTCGKPKKAIGYYEEVLTIWKKVYGENHPNVAVTLNNIGLAWCDLGDYRQCIDYLEQAISIDRVVYGNEHPNIARELSNLGEPLRTLGEPKKALDYYEQALTIWKKVYGENHPNVAVTLNNVGMVWNDLGEYNKAIESYQQALVINKKAYGENNPQAAIVLNNLGESWRALGKPKKAIEYLEQALSINRSMYGEEHPDLATVLNNLGLTWDALGEFEKARGYYEQSLVIFETVYGDKHPQEIIILGNLGEACRVLGEIEKSKNYFEKALNIWVNFGEDKRPDIPIIINNFGLTLYELGDYHRAIEYYERAVSIGLQFYGEEHPDIATFLNNLGMAWEALGEFEKARDYYEQSLVILKKIYGENQPQVAIVLNQLGESWGASGETKKAVGYFEKALKIWNKINEEKNPDKANTLNNLGLAWDALGELEKARDYYEQSLVILKRFYGENHPQVAIVLNQLGELWGILEEIKKAEYCFEEALGILEKLNDVKNPNFSNILKNLGLANNISGNHLKAIQYLERALSINRTMYGEEHPDMVVILNNLGLAWGSLEKYEKTIDYFEQLLVILKKIHKENHPQVAILLNRLGDSYKASGETEKALDYFEESLKIWEEFKDEKNPYMAYTFNNMGLALLMLNDHSRAIEFFEHALDISRKIYGEKHPDISMVLKNIGAAWNNLEDRHQAVECLEQALSIDLEVYGKYHQDVGNDLIELGATYFSWGQKKRAKSYFKKAYEILSKIYGLEHPETKEVSEWLNAC
jgi:tetratricopeptide (TPR) repeat protein